jgi:hypothetical protein
MTKDEEKKEREEREGKREKRRIKTLRTFKANPAPSIADSTFSLLISYPQSSASSMMILRPFPLSNYET